MGLKAFRFPTARKDSCNYRNVKELTKLGEDFYIQILRGKKIKSLKERSVLGRIKPHPNFLNWRFLRSKVSAGFYSKKGEKYAPQLVTLSDYLYSSFLLEC